MRVGVLPEWMSPQAGGGYTFQDDLLRALLKLRGECRHSFVLFCDPAGARERFGSLLDGPGVDVVPFVPADFWDRIVLGLNRESATFRRLRRIVRIPTKLEAALRRTGVEYAWFMSMRAEVLDMPYAAVVWDLQHRLQPWFPEVGRTGEWEKRERIYRWFLPRAASVIVGTEAGRREAEMFYQLPPGRCVVLPHPTPDFALRAPPESGRDVLQRHGLNPGYVLYPAQFWPHKNHVNLLLALRDLRERGSVLNVVFVGSDQGNRTFVEERVRALGLDSQVRILGFVSQADLIGLYRQALALGYVSFFGPENLPPLEAFALGCPVIAARVEGSEEQLGDAAILVDPSSPEEIANAILSVQCDEALRRRLVARGLERAGAWTGEHFVRGIFGVLDRFEAMRRCWPAGPA